MARGDKNYDKVTHELVKGKGKSSAEKKKAIHKMIEALIADKTEEAQTHLHAYLKLKTRDILVGEAEDADDKEIKDDEKKEEDEKDKTDSEVDSDEKKDSDKEDKEEKDIESDDKEDVKESDWSIHHPEGAMSRKIQGKMDFKGGKKGSKALKHNNHAPELSDKIEGNVDFEGKGTSKALKHGNNAPGLEDKPKGNFFKK